jgi:nickel-dependent lactate racemase
MKVRFPYGGDELVVDISEAKLRGVYLPREKPGVSDLRTEVERALSQPISSARLSELARGRKAAAIVVDDVTRFVPSREILPPLLAELAAAGIAPGDVTVIVATGLHRPLRQKELAAIRGDLPVRIINHDAKNAKELVSLGRTSLGQEIWVNRTFMESDLKILTGDVEYHQFCGYGGGAKSVYPGMADAAAIEHNHSMMEVKGTGPGRVDENPVRQEVEQVARMARVDFILNVVMNSHKEVVRAFAGDVFKAFRSGTRMVDEMYRVEVKEAVDLVITSPGGFPKDIDLYQSQKAVAAGRRIVKKGGAIVTLAECREGHGSELFDRWMTEAGSIEDIFRRIHEKFVMGGHKAYQFAREIAWAKVFLLSKLPPEKVAKYFMHPLTDCREIEPLIRDAGAIACLPKATMTLAEIPGGNE